MGRLAVIEGEIKRPEEATISSTMVTRSTRLRALRSGLICRQAMAMPITASAVARTNMAA